MNIVIFGATSKIAMETARYFARQGDRLFLVGLEKERLEVVAGDLTVLGAQNCETLVADLADLNKHPQLLDTILNKMEVIDKVLIAHGTLPDQERCQTDWKYAMRHLMINGQSVISLATLLADVFEKQGFGTMAAISSVAGDRGRKSNYLYGTAKGSISIFFEGLRNRFGLGQIKIITVKPGFVDTPMTAHLPKNGLFASPQKVAEDIFNAMQKGRPEVLYTPWFWRFIMLVIRHIPGFIFKRLNL